MDRTVDAKRSDEGVVCLRMSRPCSVEEHLACRYCWGTSAAVEGGDRGRFCDYEPGRDPLCFGFPEGTTRNLGG